MVINPAQIPQRIRDVIPRSVDGSIEKDPALLADFTKFFDEIFKDREHTGDADYCVAMDGFFTALGIPLLSGRLFDEGDTADSLPVAVISRSVAQEKWPNRNPIGQTIEFGNMDGDARLLTVVGVVQDIRDHSLESPARPTIYVNYRQRPQAAQQVAVVMLASGKPDSIYAAAREIVRETDPNIPPTFGSLSKTFTESFAARRFSLVLIGIFSAAALLLAVAGIYGVTSYAVAQRTREIGVRMALGATAKEVLIMVLGQGALTGAIGVAVGTLGSLVLTRWLRSQLFGVSTTDPATFLGVAFLLLLVTLVACWIPGRKATHIDPIEALRYE